MTLLKDIYIGFERFLNRYPKIALFILRRIPFIWKWVPSYRSYYKNYNKTSPVPKLISLTQYAKKYVPFYRTNIKSPIKNLEDFEKNVPVIDKETVRSRFNEFKSEKFKLSKHDLVTTGGSTGIPSAFYLPKNRFIKELAFVHRAWSEIGYKGQVRGVIRNHKLPENQQFGIGILTKEIYFDAYRNTPEYYDFIHSFLIKHKIRFLHGYPQMIYNLIRYFHERKKSLDFIEGILLHSEMFMPFQRQLLVEKLGLRVLVVYGNSEKITMAVDKTGKGEYEIIENYGYFELIDEKGNVIKEPGKSGLIVGSTIDNKDFPLIRFNLGDIAEYKEYGKKRVLKNIYGRSGQFLYNKDGSPVSLTSLNMHGHLLTWIEGLQYSQEKAGEFTVRYLSSKELPQEILDEMKAYFKKRFKPDTKIFFKRVEQLERLNNGKFSLLISKIEKKDS